ncbi:hypothetical protein COY93_04930 [Candidatus Uhrbacteria bacterium CG_4_10_14_0_8_um_filter_58_22]|uniref:Uncharacterized protein n=1 Tax=Candidatus Uhrbacteria bacterium CG_4_10_14_0_8_um_filter_58_22 TaxID=1975029 RepID=A0A2M7Q9X9_9BACT|nr:MAG: hypothetical protein AUJ19_00045 [Parcubacteria group bacterium CG1_02_58_44]PIY61633.1 MAG: hypothetical protein COY93_04930 [Candidatus Uhrbacteria bacterium CG_4_10_14_0_8_um_filter_58_22]
MNQKGSANIILVVVIVVLLGAVGYLALTKKSEPITEQPAPTPVSNVPISDPSQAPTPIPSSNPVGVETFSSQKLGVTFNYLKSQGSPVIEDGDKIYVGGKDGQWVQEFSKNSDDDLKAAIRKKFLVGISEQDCPVVDRTSDMENIATAEIKFGFQITDLGDPRIEASPCPEGYRATNGIRYFWMDKSHPDKFFFFSIGQYAILAEPAQTGGGEKTWQETFEVTE